ncbi:probable bifunctional dTTP/UTP pyrophosphatase/methyltransferase protein isoform X2 [Antennarius striatus]|uniref:probable bifunctional dTTP/UTP pyrophosphatase/methyltransferase protein isoform X2 n=1 Tax=Antennarius striatus TaxID=241820 RepID=UPI0035B29773
MKTAVMLNPVISRLAGKLVVLASASPRRQEILSKVGLQFVVVPSWFKEDLNKGLFMAPQDYAVETARQKAMEVARRVFTRHLKTPDIVIGADTIVTIDGAILEKPVDKQDAYRMLSRLSGKEHSVFTGVALVLHRKEKNEEPDFQVIDFYEETKVKFADLSESMLWEYINTGEPMDKAGGYGIQALGGMLVEYVHGDFLNVVGFPLNHFCKQLDRIYNQCTSFLDQDSLTNLDPPVQSPHNPVPSVNYDPSCSLGPESPSTNQILPLQEKPSASPVCEVRRSCRENQVGEDSSNILSKPVEDEKAELHTCESTAPPLRSGGGPGDPVSVREREDSEPNTEDLHRLMSLLDGFRASQALFTASRLCVFDVLHHTPGLDAAQVAQEVRASAKGTERLLEACVSLGLLKSSSTRQKHVYQNTDLATSFLVSDSSLSLHCYVQYCHHKLWPLFSHLEGAVQEGSSQQEAFSRTPTDRSQVCARDAPDVRLRFMKAMHSYATVTARAVVTAFDLSSFKTACDLGGCTGAIAYELSRAHPELRVTVFDLPPVVEMSQQFRPQQPDGRVSFVAGDFFKDHFPTADLYVLARVLHDLPEEKIHILLRKIADVCKPGGGVLLIEIFLEEDRGAPSRGLLQALSMGDGRQRSASEYSRLLESQGFITTGVRHTHNLLDAMLCIKA